MKKLNAGVIHSAGWLINEDDKAYYIVGSINPKDDQVGDTRMILKGTVTDYKVIANKERSK